MEEATIALQAEFSTGVWTDFMPDVLLGRGLGFDYGIKGVGPMDLVASTGTLRLALDNRESNSAAKRGYYTPGHADKRSGWDEGIPVRMKFTYAGLDRYKWLGRVASIEPEAGSFLGGDARVQAVDWMDIASRAKLKQLGIVTSKRVDQILPIILADMPVPPRATSYATGVETFASFFNTDRDEGTTILALLQKAARNEYGLIYLKGGSCPTGLNVDLQMICPYDGGPNSNEGHVGTASGVSYAAGKYGQGVEIAAGDTLTYPNPLSAAGGSLALWWKPSADNTGPTRYLFSEGNLKAYFNAADDQIYFTDGTNTVTTAALTFAADVWQHLVFTWGPAGLQIIRNGVLEPGPEKLTNGGFETAGGGGADVFGTWTEQLSDGVIADEGTLFHGGAHACKLTAGPNASTMVYQDHAVVPGSTYQLTFWTRGDGTNGGRYGVYDFTHSAWIIYFTTPTGVSGATYTLVSVPFTAPVGCVSAGPAAVCSSVNGGIAYFDDVSIKAIVTPYTPPTLGPTLYIGSDTSGGNQCDGLIDDLGIAYYPLTVAQAAAIYASSGDLTTYHATQGILRFDSRHSRGLNLTSIVTLDQTMLDLDVSYDRQYIYNLVKARAFPLKVDAAATTVLYELQVPLSIGAGQSVTLELPYRDPTTAKRISASEVVSPLVADTGFKFGSSQGTANDLNASLGISLTIGGNTTTVTLTNNASVLAWLNVLKLHGKGIYPYDPQTLKARDQASIDKRGELLLQFDLEQIDSATKAETYAAYLKNRYHLPQKLARRVRFLANQSAALMAAALDGEPSSRFTMKESMTAIDSDWFINAVKFDVEAGGLIYCEWIAVPADTAPMWIWNTSLWNTDTWGF